MRNFLYTLLFLILVCLLLAWSGSANSQQLKCGVLESVTKELKENYGEISKASFQMEHDDGILPVLLLVNPDTGTWTMLIIHDTEEDGTLGCLLYNGFKWRNF